MRLGAEIAAVAAVNGEKLAALVPQRIDAELQIDEEFAAVVDD